MNNYPRGAVYLRREGMQVSTALEKVRISND